MDMKQQVILTIGSFKILGELLGEIKAIFGLDTPLMHYQQLLLIQELAGKHIKNHFL